MYCRLAFLNKLPSLSTAEFKDYYENHHVPLVVSLSGDKLPLIYKRRYADHSSGRAPRAPAGTDVTFDWDVVVELGFADESGFDAWLLEISRDGRAAIVAEDEAKFLDHARIRMIKVDEFVTNTAHGT